MSDQEFGRCQRVDPHILEGYIFFVVESVEFNLKVFTPYCAIRGFIYNLEPFVQHMNLAHVQALEELQRVAT